MRKRGRREARKGKRASVPSFNIAPQKGSRLALTTSEASCSISPMGTAGPAPDAHPSHACSRKLVTTAPPPSSRPAQHLSSWQIFPIMNQLEIDPVLLHPARGDVDFCLQETSSNTCIARALQPGAQGRLCSTSPHVAHIQLSGGLMARPKRFRRHLHRHQTDSQQLEQPNLPHMMHQPTRVRSRSTVWHLGQRQPGRNGK